MSESKKSAEQVEQERLTRRQALRKFGFGAGLSAILLLGADDLARMVGAKMQQMEGDSKVADRIAKEFQSVGVAFAAGPSNPCIGRSGSAYYACCEGLPTTSQCQDCCGTNTTCIANCTPCPVEPC